MELPDESLDAAAAREACEETKVQLSRDFEPKLAGVDVHGIPGKRDEPYHLHHDLIWCFRALTEEIEQTDEAPEVMWASAQDFNRLELTESIRRTALRTEVFS